MAPTLLADVPGDAIIADNEVFGPVLTVTTYDTIEEAFAKVNSSRYGLQAGVFTTHADNGLRRPPRAPGRRRHHR